MYPSLLKSTSISIRSPNIEKLENGNSRSHSFGSRSFQFLLYTKGIFGDIIT